MLPTFRTDRLTLRSRTLEDLSACLMMDRDPDVTKYIPGPWGDPVRHEAFVRDRIDRDYGAGLGYWSVFPHQAPDRFLGWVFLIPLEGRSAEIGWRFTRASWGKDYATEAARAIRDHGLQIQDFAGILAEIHPKNTGSIRVAQKLQMKDIGLHENEGSPCRLFVMPT